MPTDNNTTNARYYTTTTGPQVPWFNQPTAATITWDQAVAATRTAPDDEMNIHEVTLNSDWLNDSVKSYMANAFGSSAGERDIEKRIKPFIIKTVKELLEKEGFILGRIPEEKDEENEIEMPF